MVLGYSRALAALFTLDQTLESFLRGHVHAFDALGGVARNLVYDNLRSAVLDRRGAAVQFHPRLLELAGHYHFAPRPCTPGRRKGEGQDRTPDPIPTRGVLRRPSLPRPRRHQRPVPTLARRGRTSAAAPRAARPQCRRRLGRGEAPPAAAARQSLRDRPGACRPLRQDPLRPLRPQPLLDPPHPHPQAADPGRLGHPRPHPRRTQRADRPSPHLRHRADRRGPRPSGKPARRHPPGQRHTPPATGSAPPSPPPPRSSSVSHERQEALRPHATRLLALLDDYGPEELAKAVHIALERDALGAGSITHILETRRRQRGLKPPLRLTLPDRPGLRDLDVQPHDLETYDALGRHDHDDDAAD